MFRKARYDEQFYKWYVEGSLRSALRILPIVFAHYRPRSVVDFGCGVGTWLRAVRELGVEKILGMDGAYVEQGMLQIPAEYFLAADLADRCPPLGRRFDLAMSLEVAEHLPKSRAETFVGDVCEAADTVVFSAAIPGQGGTHHVNEQYPSFWIPMFQARGFKTYDFVRPEVWGDRSVEVWYRQNVLVFSRSESFPGYRQDARSCDLVHPEFWDGRGKVCKASQELKRKIKMMRRRIRAALGTG